MTILNPDQLVEEFKKSGEFDRLRRELLAQFRSSDGMNSLMSRVEDITRQKFASDPKLQYMPDPMLIRELMQELDRYLVIFVALAVQIDRSRYPIVERAVADAPALSDPRFVSSIRESIGKTLYEHRKKSNPSSRNSLMSVSTHLEGQPAPQVPLADSVKASAQGPTSHDAEMDAVQADAAPPHTDPADPVMPPSESVRAVHFAENLRENQNITEVAEDSVRDNDEKIVPDTPALDGRAS
ncbi:uncharacterized protein FIBRA_07888 [Fibroporia radiculosa]|uniref:BOD1/SHG1 domain-containing protein n=1 Tax=Fibroporia radiculosa TaxID=599839 RepID=J4GFU3_9APHY|nr:uncharacterized protein FIBRA_07888 [Fibroporia radiculosa]CCM05658.1 predicted protein [Fibroporia radiculosa]